MRPLRPYRVAAFPTWPPTQPAPERILHVGFGLLLTSKIRFLVLTTGRVLCMFPMSAAARVRVYGGRRNDAQLVGDDVELALTGSSVLRPEWEAGCGWARVPPDPWTRGMAVDRKGMVGPPREYRVAGPGAQRPPRTIPQAPYFVLGDGRPGAPVLDVMLSYRLGMPRHRGRSRAEAHETPPAPNPNHRATNIPDPSPQPRT